MTKKSHNKKRNVGIIYEQLILTLTKSLVENDMKSASTAKDIIKKYFAPGKELYKEYRLFNSLVEYHVADGSLATRILQEAQSAATRHNKFRLNKEKSALIKEINYSFGADFYKRRVKNYRDYATVQRLLNNWREGSRADLQERILLEKSAHNLLLTELTKPQETLNIDSSNLVVKIMTEKFNSKYGNKFSDQQKTLIKNYALSNDQPNFNNTLKSIKENALKNISRYEKQCQNTIVRSKIKEVSVQLKNLKEHIDNDQDMAKFLTLCQLTSELTGDDNE